MQKAVRAIIADAQRHRKIESFRLQTTSRFATLNAPLLLYAIMISLKTQACQANVQIALNFSHRIFIFLSLIGAYFLFFFSHYRYDGYFYKNVNNLYRIDYRNATYGQAANRRNAAV